MERQFETAVLKGPATPLATETATLFDSTVTYGPKMMRMLGVCRIVLSFPGLNQPSGTSGLIGYASSDGGTTWKNYAFPYSTIAGTGALPQTVAADTGSTFAVYDISVQFHQDVKLTWTAAATAPTAGFPPVIEVKYNDVHVNS